MISNTQQGTRPEPATSRAPIAVISPHLDDAVFGCGQLLATRPGSVVITVFAGRPPHCRLTEWDAASGFGQGDDVIGLRREEDARALGVLGGAPVWLDFCDAQYGHSPTSEVLAAALEREVLAAAKRTIYMPLGLFHDDHKCTRRAALRVLLRHPEFDWFIYEEPTYRAIPGLVEDKLASKRAIGIAVGSTICSDQRGAELKRRAVGQYRSQLRALATPGRPGTATLWEPEHYRQVRVSRRLEIQAIGR